MSKQPKTRVVVSYESNDRELFSVQELASGDLVIVARHEENFEDVRTGERSKMALERMTVHYSPESDGTTFMRHIILESGEKRTGSAFIKNSKDSLFAQLWSKLCPELNDRYVRPPRPRDTVCRIGEFHQRDMTTLIYTVMISNVGKRAPDNLSNTRTSISFSRFDVSIYSSYLNIPANTYCANVMRASSAEWINGKPISAERNDGLAVVRADELPALLLDCQKRLTSTVKQRRARAAPPNIAEAIDRYPTWFHPTPGDLALGRLERNEQPLPFLLQDRGLWRPGTTSSV
ncbi:MAG: hypothetical protein JHD15_25250 [Phenylobacterium sp.]|uniref:hypothetical protein n=1 Tax=Phenylobacterium sp. TaxID=1871053 RepID=UPI001A199D53|nr:hypothetical protein [Phenylobacterium sp.]MBJ7413636.1 hypothetical protein [Phenylobacterium sp.]